MEEEKKINWLSLFIKVIIIFAFVLIIMWLISKIIGTKKLSKTFTNNLDNMSTVAVDYFKTIDLPQEKGNSIKITLGQMIDKKLIVSINEGTKNSCDTEKSYSVITRKDSNYLVETTLKCGKEKDTKKVNFEFKDCKNCNDSNNDENKTNENNSNNQNKVDNKDNSSSKGITYYEYVKETTDYTKWMRGSLTGNNIENKYEYYSVAEATYYSLHYVSLDTIKKNNTLNYTLKLDKVPNKDYYFTTIKESDYFSKDEQKEYLTSNTIHTDKKESLSGLTDITNYSLNSDNFSYKLSPYYRKGSFYVNVTVTIKNTNNLESYTKGNAKNIVFIPLKMTINFASPKIVTERPSDTYVTIPYYRYVTVNREVKWSTENSLEGYTKTGNTKVE